MKLFAISDLHLSLGVDKPMDIFGPQWVGHEAKMREAWDRLVTADDWVLVGGDVSWGLDLAQARPDLDWIGERPGRKVLIKGNHCTWWSSRSKVEKVLHPSIQLLQNNAILLDDGTAVLGTRLWDPPGAPWADPGAEKIFRRELERLRISVAQADAFGDRAKRRIALVHYPPRYSDGRATDAVPILEAAGVEQCIYGHLHGEYHHVGFQGVANGIRYWLTAVDAIDFRPIEIPLGSPATSD
jgi:predicted phosphohydrolase